MKPEEPSWKAPGDTAGRGGQGGARRRPRLLQFVNSFHLGGTEGQVLELLRGLRADWSVEAAAVHLEGPHLASVRALGLEPLPVPLGGSFAGPQTLSQILRLARWLEDEKIELVHAHDFYTALLAVPAARLARAKVVVGRLDLSHWLNPPQRLALAAVTRAADGVIANARAIRRQVCRQELLSESRVSVIPNGIDLANFDRARAAGLKEPLPELEGRVVIAHVANMTHPVKAQELLFEAMSALVVRRPQAALLLVGDGPRRPMLEGLVAGARLGDHVFFLGRRSDVPAVLARCDLAVLCSQAEGLANAIIEGLAAGLPMVVTDAGGNPELVSDGHSGFVVPVGSSLGLAARLETLIDSRPLRLEMGQAGRAFVERELVLARLLERHDALYRRVLGVPGEGAAPAGD